MSQKKNYACASNALDYRISLSIEEQPGAALDFLMELRQRLPEKGFIVPTSEIEIRFLARCRNDLSPYYYLSIPSDEALDRILDKYRFYEELVRHGLDTPKTFLLESPDSWNLPQEEIPYPCILKPVFSGDWKSSRSPAVVGGSKAIVVKDVRDLSRLYDRVKVLNPNVLLQEIVPCLEEETYSCCCYADEAGRVLWGFVTQKLLQYPPGFGTAVLCQTVEEPEIEAVGRRVVGALRIDGISEVEIIKDRNTGRFRIIEVNTRHWQQHILAGKLGPDITRLDYCYRTGQRERWQRLLRQALPPRRPAAVWIDDIGYLTHCIKNGPRPKNWMLGQLRGKRPVFSVFSARDPVPFIQLLKERLKRS